ncbi:MAG: DNA primase [Anaerovorax sp.]
MSTSFQDNIIAEIKNRCDIVEVIGRHIPLKKTGSNYKGVCPFHNEKTPSFVVSETKQIFTCFGCGATGDVIEFVKKYNNLDFPEAVEKLATELGIEIKNTGYKQDDRKALMYDLNRQAATFFYINFKNKKNPAYAYMKKRGLEDETLRKFGIGYADGGWTSLYDHFVKQGVDVEVLVELGLVSKSKGNYYDKFRDRVIFPIINTRGKVVGFGGRAIGDGVPKYLNSPETPIFSKKNNLYGLNLSRTDISKENSAILVEGYMDVISLYQHGIHNVSASLGTALTDSQGAMLKRYTQNVMIAYDGDQAGIAATLRGLDILHHVQCKVKVLQIQGEKDPDEFIKKKGRQAFEKLIEEALPFAEYKIKLLKEKFDLSTVDGSVSFLQEASKILKTLSPVEADVYIKKIAYETKITEGAIRREIFGNNNENATGLRSQEKQWKNPKEMGTMLEKNFIKLMLVDSGYVPKIKEFEEIFVTQQARKIYREIVLNYQNHEEVDLNKVKDNLEPAENEVLADILENIQLSDKNEQIFLECVHEIKRQDLIKREEEIIKVLSIIDEEKEDSQERVKELLSELAQIQEKKKHMKK